MGETGRRKRLLRGPRPHGDGGRHLVRRCQRPLSSVRVLVLAVVFGVSCGGSSQSPTSPSATPSLRAGTTLTFVSGETGQPVAGATVTVAGTSYTTSANGEISFGSDVDLNSTLDVAAAGFLERQTIGRSTSATRFTLWPKASPTGLTEQTTEAIIYTANSCPFDSSQLGQAPLNRLRPGATQVFVVPSTDITSDSAATAGMERGVAVMNAATHGAVVYSIVSAAPSDAVSFGLKIDPQARACQSFGLLGATTAPTILGTGIMGGTIAFCSLLALHNPILVAHELGHTFGLHHSADVTDVMFCSGSPSQSFTPREQLLMGLTLQRSQGNRFPDDDRGVATASGARATTEAIECGFTPERVPH